MRPSTQQCSDEKREECRRKSRGKKKEKEKRKEENATILAKRSETDVKESCAGVPCNPSTSKSQDEKKYRK